MVMLGLKTSISSAALIGIGLSLFRWAPGKDGSQSSAVRTTFGTSIGHNLADLKAYALRHTTPCTSSVTS